MDYCGSHMSISGTNLPSILETCRKLDMNAIQIFIGLRSSPSKFSNDDIIRFKYMKEESDIKVYVHMPFIFNTSSFKGMDWKKPCFLKYIDACIDMNIDGLVWHPGAHTDCTLNEGIDVFHVLLSTFVNHTKGSNLKLLPENTGTKGTQIASSLDVLRQLIDPYPEVDVTLDYCHLWGSGYDLRDQLVLDEIKTLFKDRIGLIHCNNSLASLGSYKDRHGSILENNCGLGMEAEEMTNVITQFKDIPHVLERDVNIIPIEELLKLQSI